MNHPNAVLVLAIRIVLCRMMVNPHLLKNLTLKGICVSFVVVNMLILGLNNYGSRVNYLCLYGMYDGS